VGICNRFRELEEFTLHAGALEGMETPKVMIAATTMKRWL
jgi:hypothetical protein